MRKLIVVLLFALSCTAPQKITKVRCQMTFFHLTVVRNDLVTPRECRNMQDLLNYIMFIIKRDMNQRKENVPPIPIGL